MVFSSPAGKKEALRSEIAWTALLRDLRSTNMSGLRTTQQTLRKKRSLVEDISGTPEQDKKVCCRRRSTHATKDALFGSSSATFLDLSPPAPSVGRLRFTFGRQHYTSISLPTLSKSSCGCSTGAQKFDVFSSYHCPCNTRSKNSSSATKANKRDSSSARNQSVCC